MWMYDMKRIIAIILCVLSLVSLCSCGSEKEKYTAYYFDWFDTVTVITGYEHSQEDFDSRCLQISAILSEYHKLFDIYTRYDGINNLVTVNDGGTVIVDEKIIDMLEFSKQMYNETSGKVNVAMGSVLSIWHDCRTYGLNHPESAYLPNQEKLTEAAKHMNIDDLVIDRDNMSVCLADEKMSLDVGAIAKGYAAARVCEYLEDNGITGYVINLGGNVCTVGTKANGDSWTVGIENPLDESGDKPYLAYLNISDMSLVTSGSYQRYYVVDGVSYHHIIDPDTLRPENRYLSVSVLYSDSGVADAYSTALFNMNLQEGLALVESVDGMEAMWVTPDGEITRSSGFENYTIER